MVVLYHVQELLVQVLYVNGVCKDVVNVRMTATPHTHEHHEFVCNDVDASTVLSARGQIKRTFHL